jgi:hypothetical protein
MEKVQEGDQYQDKIKSSAKVLHRGKEEHGKKLRRSGGKMESFGCQMTHMN